MPRLSSMDRTMPEPAESAGDGERTHGIEVVLVDGARLDLMFVLAGASEGW